MKSVNKVILIGNLGKDPEMKFTQGGMPVAKFSIATNERFKDKDGNWQDRTEWHNIVAFQRLAEIIGQYLKKGGKCYIEGSLRTGSWDDKETGKKMYYRQRARVAQRTRRRRGWRARRQHARGLGIFRRQQLRPDRARTGARASRKFSDHGRRHSVLELPSGARLCLQTEIASPAAAECLR
jgi:single stranded DNA-binding protein